MSDILHVLLLEDRETDAELTLNAVRRAGFEPTWTRVETEKAFIARLDDRIDVILADYSMPQFSALIALEILNQRGLNIPFIIVSGTIGEETAVEAIKKGASDYLLKDRLGRLGNAIHLAIDQKKLKEERNQMTDALVRAEAKYRSIFENSVEGIYQSTPDGRYVTANPALARMFGYDSPGELIADVTHIGRQLYVDPEERATFRGLLEQNNVVMNFEAKVRRRDGQVIWVSEQARTVRDEHGTILFFEGFVQNITDRQEAEEKLMRAQKMEAIGHFAGGVAHDFNNIITVISGVSELIRDELPDHSAVRDYIQEIQRATQQAALLTRQLLALGRKQIMENKVFDLNELIANIEKMLVRVIGEDVELKTHTFGKQNLVKADPGQIEQVILNLVVNARDAMPGGGKLTIETSTVTVDQSCADAHSHAQAGLYERISVSDTGSGMTREVLAHIFEPFFTTKEVGKGTGLGLATSFGIIKQSNGFISVQSDRGVGSTFLVHLPSAPDKIAALKFTCRENHTPRGSETILLVEDDASVRKLSARILEKLGYKVITAADGTDALRTLASHSSEIDMIFTDVIMPKTGGQALHDQVLTKWPHMKFLFCSGYTDQAIGNHGVLDPAMPYLQKPFSPQQLATKVREVMDRDSHPGQNATPPSG